MNRIKSVVEAQLNSSGGWTFNLFTQNFGYDRWRNRTVSCSPCQPGVTGDVFTIDAATNRITAKNGNGMTYDLAGNQTYDATGNRWFDGENRMNKATQGGTTSHYVYDADGKRVRRIIGSTETWMIYGVDGELVAEYAAAASVTSPQKEYGYRSGQMLIAAETSPLKITWLVTDHLGTPRMNIRGTGTDGGSLASVTRHDYLPFGEDLIAGIRVNGGSGQHGYEPPTDGVRQKFGSKERDTETGLDFFGFRYYSSTQGRFTTPDGPFNDQHEVNPQSWNLYTYVRNSPTNLVDPDGRSTHTDKDGRVVAVYEDGDLGVYSHDNLKKWNGKDTLASKGKGITRQGETEYWDEFREHDDKTGAVKNSIDKNARILFGQSWDNDISTLNAEARGMRLGQIADASRPGRHFDIKNDTALAPYGHHTGKLLNGKYATAESAGDYLAGYNGATSTITGLKCCGYIDYVIYANMAGALQQKKWEGGATTFAKIMSGTTYGPPPYYGETPYAGRRIKAGFNRGVIERNK